MVNSYPHERIPGLVSVIIPAYNAENSLRRAMESALAQTYQPIEVIVINDGSTDSTEKIAASFLDRIRFVQQENRGETSTRNRGFEMSRGEFITFLDHDDYWDPEFIRSCVEFLSAYPDVIAVSVGVESSSALKPGKSFIRPRFLCDPASTLTKPFVVDDLFSFYAKYDHLHPGSAVIRGSVIDHAGGQRADLVLSGDMEYWVNLATFGKWGFIPKILLHADGGQVPRGSLYRKFHNRYSRCATVESWESRILPRLKASDMSGFAKLRGRIATWYTFAHVFVGKDAEAKRCAAKYRKDLEGKFGRLWRLGLLGGWLTWKPLCIALRARTRLQYWQADHR